MNRKKRENKKIKTKSQGGFSLVEVLLVVAIFAIAFVAVYGFYSSTMKFNVENRYEVVASNLAQEGIEIMRNVRDENILNGRNINSGLSAGLCYPHIDSGGNTSCQTGISKKTTTTNGWYENCSNDSCVSTPFSRQCQIVSSSVEQINITCEVSWASFVNGQIRKVSINSILTDWQKE